jgi:O-antigen ligase
MGRLRFRSTTFEVPRALAVVVALTVGTSFYVVVEPAPCDLFFLVLCGVLVVQQRWFAVPTDLNPVLIIGILLYILGSIVSLMMSSEFLGSLLHMTITFYMFVYWIVFVLMTRRFGVELYLVITRAFIFAAVAAAVVGFAQTFGIVTSYDAWLHGPIGPRATSTFKDPNVYAPFLCVAFMLVLHDMIVARRSVYWTTPLLCLFATGILGAFSRGAFVNLLVALTIFAAVHVMVIQQGRLVRRLVIAMLLLAAVVLPVLTVYLAQADLDQFLAQRLSLQEYDSERFGTQSLALETIGENPLGLGPGQARRVFPLSTHNVYLQVATENGLIGALGFYLFLLAALHSCFRGVVRTGPYRALYGTWLAILAGIAVNSLAIDSLHWRHFFLFLALPVGLWQHELWAARARGAIFDRAPSPAG